MARLFSLDEKRRLLEKFKRSRGNKKIRDFEEIAEAFDCRWKVSQKNHQIFIPPDETMMPVNVAIPHSNDNVLKKYESRFVNMLADILDLEEKGEEKREQKGR